MAEEDPPKLDDDNESVQITFETPNGRSVLDANKTPEEREREPEADEVEEDEVQVTVGDEAEIPRGVDPDTYAIDAEIVQPGEEGERYPGWRIGLSRKLGAYIELIRPFTLLAPFFGGLGASLVALSVQDFEGFDWPTLIYGVGTLMLLNAASNCMNAAYDAHIDRINKPYRPIPRGLVTRDEALSLAWFLYFLALFRALLLSFQFGALVLLIVVITIYYSLPPIRLKKRFWASNISIAFARGMLGFVAAWTIFGDPTNPIPWFIGFFLFIFLLGATTSKDFTDLDGDRKYGMQTLPVVYGPKRAALITGPFFILPFILIPVGVLQGFLIEKTQALLLLVVWGIYVMVVLQNHATERDPNFENSPVWKHMYLMLFALQLGFAGVYLAEYLGL